MAGKKTSAKGGKVRAQYEDYPYPHRNPKDEKKRLVTGSPSQLNEVAHYLFKGEIPTDKPFRVLVAGGGTGDALMMLAQQLKDAGIQADIHYLDLSSASRAIAEERARIRGLDTITFHSGSLLEAPELGRFDYIDCCGVLHHLPVPGEGFRALKDALGPEGGMGVMVYGELGRTGVYHAQEMLRLVAGEGASDKRVDLAKKLLGELPETNWLKRNELIRDHKESDAGLFDLFLHSQDRAYRVGQLADVVSAAGLGIVSFIDPARYDPMLMVRDADLRARLEPLSSLEKAVFAELFTGNMRKHIAYLTHAGREDACPARGASPHSVPVFKDAQTQALLHQLPPGAKPAVEVDGMKATMDLPPQAAVMLKAVNGRRSLEQIRLLMPGRPDWFAFSSTFTQMFRTLNAFGMMFFCRIPG